MTLIRFAPSGGENRALEPKLLLENVGVVSRFFCVHPKAFFMCNGDFWVNATRNTASYSLVSYTKSFRPSRYCLRLSECLDKSIHSGVAMLRRLSSPAAIFRRIVSVVIYSVKSMPFWPFSHIANKICKSVPPAPSVTNANTPSPIVVELSEPWTIAPVTHLPPSGVERVVISPLGVSVRCDCLDIVFPAKATARHRVTAAERVGVNGGYFPALASATPFYSPIAFNTVFESYGKSAKNLFREVYKRAHFVVLRINEVCIVSCKRQAVATITLPKVRHEHY